MSPLSTFLWGSAITVCLPRNAYGTYHDIEFRVSSAS
jgi:hypothetical protein